MPVSLCDNVNLSSEPLAADDICEAAESPSHYVNVLQAQQLVKQLAEAETARDALEAQLAASTSGAADMTAEALKTAQGDGDGAWSVQKVCRRSLNRI
jgi:hypothetical protein